MDPFRSLPFEDPGDDRRAADAYAMGAELAGTLRTAAALSRNGRQIDLAGLDRLAGRLCAAVLDLAPEQGRALQPLLQDLLAQLDALQACLPLSGYSP